MAMIHPLLRLAVTEPHLIGDHVEAYAALVGEELSKASMSWALRAGLFVTALAMALVGLVLVGVSLLLTAGLPSGSFAAPWAMVVIPLAPFLIAAICVMVARSKPTTSAFDKIKSQLNADMAMLREASAA